MGGYMGSLKNIISIWIIANILFIPAFKSVDLVQDQSKHVCMIDTFENKSKEKNLILKSYCENCNFFHDYDNDSFGVTAGINKCHILVSSTIKSNSLLFTSKNYSKHTRAPPYLS